MYIYLKSGFYVIIIVQKQINNKIMIVYICYLYYNIEIFKYLKIMNNVKENYFKLI